MIFIYIVICWLLRELDAPVWVWAMLLIGAMSRIVHNFLED